MESERERWDVGRMCRLLKLSRSGFYAWRRKPSSARSTQNEGLIREIRRIYAEG